MTPEQFVVWLRNLLERESQSQSYQDQGTDPRGVVRSIRGQLDTVVLKTQPPQPGVPGVLGQGLMKLEKADPTAIPVFNGGGCQ